MKPVKERLSILREANLARRLRQLDSPQGREVGLDGNRLLNFSSNDTLGLASHPALVEAAKRGLDERGHGAGAARLLSGGFDLAHELEAELASWLGGEAALLFSSGYHANVGVISALADSGRIFSDELNHASIIDGVRLSRAERHIYPHCSPPANLRDDDLLVTESVFSMEGVSRDETLKLLAQTPANVIVDEAHAIGWAGREGQGLADAATFCRIGTLGKALGSYGAFVVGSRDLIDLLTSTARSFIFTTGLPASVLAASLAAVRLCRSGDGNQRRQQLERNCGRLRELDSLTGDGPIFLLEVGDSKRALTLSAALEEDGLLVQAVRPPTVRSAALRIVVSASHTEADVSRLLEALRRSASSIQHND